jgi:hypothetical protein
MALQDFDPAALKKSVCVMVDKLKMNDIQYSSFDATAICLKFEA